MSTGGGRPHAEAPTAIGVDKIERDSIVDAIEDWRDANDTTRMPMAPRATTISSWRCPTAPATGTSRTPSELARRSRASRRRCTGPRGQAGPRSTCSPREPRHRQHQYRARAGAPAGPGRCRDQPTSSSRAPTTPTRQCRRGSGGPGDRGSTTFRIEAEGIGGEPGAHRRDRPIVQPRARARRRRLTVCSWQSLTLKPPARDGAPPPAKDTALKS